MVFFCFSASNVQFISSYNKIFQRLNRFSKKKHVDDSTHVDYLFIQFGALEWMMIYLFIFGLF